MTTKSCYLYLLSENVVQPHYVMKFASTFGRIHWPTTWRPLSFFDLDRQVIDLNWKIAHGVLYTAQRLASFGLSVPLPCFCGSPVESLEHLFFSCPLAQSVLCWLQSLMFSYSSMCPVILCHVLFGFSPDELRDTPRIFAYLLNVCKFVIWQSRNADYRFRDLSPGATSAVIKVRARGKFNLPLFFKRFRSARRSIIFIDSGVQMVWLNCLCCCWSAYYVCMISFVLFLCPLVLGLLCWCTAQRLVSVLSPPVLSCFVLSCL